MSKRPRKQNKLDKIEDCYYYLYSTCKRGDNCGFRHNLLSKQCNILCEEWSKLKTCREECPLRHSYYHLKKNRSEEMCHWEANGGCKKEFCEFMHNEIGKDDWKEGRIKDISEIKKDKNIIRQEITVDPLEFEEERREVKERKRHLKIKKRAKKDMAANLKKALLGMEEDQRKEFERVLNLMEGKATKEQSNEKAEDDFDAEMKELDDLCK